MRLLLSLLLFLPALAIAQPAGEGFIDVVYLYGGDQKTGTVITYEHGKRVVLVTEGGETLDLKWDEVKRVNFRRDDGYTPDPDRIAARRIAREVVVPEVEPETDTAPTRPRPTRKILHQVTGALGFGVVTPGNGGGGFRVPAIGANVAYHVMRPVGPVNVGLGLDVGFLNHARQENVLALTAQVEYALLPDKRFKPVARLEVGPTWPFGGGAVGEELSDRKLTPLLHPSIGFDVAAKDGRWGSLFFDVGYRFLSSSFTITTETLDVIQRRVNYRRLVLRGGLRF